MKSVFNQNKIFILLHVLCFCVAVIVIFNSDKLNLHLFFNGFVTPLFDCFFEYTTYVGDGIFIIPFIFLMLFFNMQKSITLLLAYLISAGVTQGIKMGFFRDYDRPFLVFRNNHIPLKVIEGVNLNIHHSFPSGHTTAAFSMFFCLSFFSKNKLTQVLCFIAALLVAFSRVYLSQHFFEDITVGSFVGVLFSWLVCAILYYTKISQKYNALNKPIWQLF